jgi:hypothetical protein
MTSDAAHSDDADDLLADDAFDDLPAQDSESSPPIQSAAEMEAAIDEADKKALKVLRRGCTSKSVECFGEWMIAPADQMGLCEPSSESRPAHSPDYRSVNWFGREFTFTPTQAACVKVLWEAWQNKTPDVGGQTVLEAVDAHSDRLDHVFRSGGRIQHLAWGEMIVAGDTKGSYRLAPPLVRCFGGLQNAHFCAPLAHIPPVSLVLHQMMENQRCFLQRHIFSRFHEWLGDWA